MAVAISAALLAFYEDHKHPWPTLQECTWPEIVELLTEHQFTECAPCPGGSCKEKFTEAFSPGAPRAGTARADKNVDSVSLLVFDFDHLTRAQLEEVVDRLAGLESVLYSTHSNHHKGPDDCCVRIVFPLSRALKPHEFRHVRAQVIARYGLTSADPSPKDLSRLYFLPTAPIGMEVEAGHQEGALLDLDELLKDCPPAGKARVMPSAPYVSVPLPVAVNMDLLRELLKGYRPSDPEPDQNAVITRKELVQRVYNEKPLVKDEEEGQRDISCHRIAKILAYLFPLDTPEEAITEIVRASVSKMPVYDTDGPDDTLDARFEKIRKSWHKGIAERAELEATRKAEAKALSEKFNARFKNRRRAAAAPPEPGPDGPPPPDGAPPPSGGGGDEGSEPFTEDELNDALHYRMVKKTPVLLDFLANVILIMSFHPEWDGLLRYNEITKNIDLSDGHPLEEHETSPTQLVTGVKFWLQAKYKTNFKTSDVVDALVHVAKGNAYNPLHDYLNGVTWDGVSRADTFLETYCGASLIGVDEKDITSYVRKVSRRWLVSAVARALSPGCKMDTVLILEGKTGIYKSTALKALGGPFFSDSKIAIGEKDAMQLAGTNWIHEIAELTAFHASETEQQKAFFSSPVDQFRAPYDRVPDKYPRLACFVGSTNDERYMNDPTGNRRYQPIECVRLFAIRELRRDRDQLWAEAVAIYRAGLTCLKCQALNVGLPSPWYDQYAHDRCAQHRWWFDTSENDELERVNIHRLRAEYADTIRDYILRLEKDFRRPKYTLNEIALEMLKLAPDRVQSQAPAIGRALKVLGFTKERAIEEGSQVRLHVVPPLLLEAKKKPSPFEERSERAKAAEAKKNGGEK